MKSSTITISNSIALCLILIACAKSPSSNEETISRPASSEASAKEILNKHDHSVGTVMRTVRELKSSIKKEGAKVTPIIEANINDMITEAKGYQSQLSELTDKLSKEDFDLFERNSKRLREKETEFETLKQSK